MGCTTSHHASSSSSRRATDPAAACRERTALIQGAADRLSVQAAAHTAYFRSHDAVGGALRSFANEALLPAAANHPASPVLTLPPPPAKPVSATARTASTLSHSLSDDSHCDDEDLHSLSDDTYSDSDHEDLHTLSDDSESDGDINEEDLHPLDHSRRSRHRKAPAPQPAEFTTQQCHRMMNFGTARNGNRDVMEVLEEARARFDESVDYGDEVSKLLEVGNVPHGKTHKALIDSYATLSFNGGRNPDLSLSSTLEMLSSMENKLYQHVKMDARKRWMYDVDRRTSEFMVPLKKNS